MRDGPSELEQRFATGPPGLVDRLLADASVDVQHEVLDELAEYVALDEGMYAPTTALPASSRDSFHHCLRRIAELLDPDVVAGHPGLTPEFRIGLLALCTNEALHGPQARRHDASRGLDRVSYLVAGPPSHEVVEPPALHQKARAIELIGSSITTERIRWVPAGATITLTASRLVDLPPVPVARRSALQRLRDDPRSLPAIVRGVLHDRALLRRSRRADVASRYSEAWLLMDRDTSAHDNAEHLYRYLRAHEPQVNAWFVLNRSSRDWARLSGEGFRLIEHGSDEHYLALLHCQHLISSQVDGYVVRPFLGHVLGPQRWRYSFLQHGVITQDLSRWLNIKPIDLMVTSTPREQHSVAGDGTPYLLTDLESVQVGLARHDRLVHLGATAPKHRLLVTPTWRSELLGEQAGSNQRTLLPDFWSSRYATAWTDLLTAPALRELCEQAGWQLTFMPHPNMQDYLATSPLPEYVRTLRFDDVDVQQVFAEASAWVTDYSSLGTEAALLECPVVYHQFERDEFYRGRLYQQGVWWSYAEDGYGPVTESVDETVAALATIAAEGLAPLYRERMRAGVPLRDGRNCERTVEAIRAITRRRSSR